MELAVMFFVRVNLFNPHIPCDCFGHAPSEDSATS